MGCRGADAAPILTYRTIDLRRDVRLAVAHHVDACVASFGSDARFKGESSYVNWLRSRIEEYPDGHVLAYRAPSASANSNCRCRTG